MELICSRPDTSPKGFTSLGFFTALSAVRTFFLFFFLSLPQRGEYCLVVDAQPFSDNSLAYRLCLQVPQDVAINCK